jgi:hypothetical protein
MERAKGNRGDPQPAPDGDPNRRRGEILIHHACLRARLAEFEVAEEVIASIPIEFDRKGACFALVGVPAQSGHFEKAWDLTGSTPDRGLHMDMVRSLADGIQFRLTREANLRKRAKP